MTVSLRKLALAAGVAALTTAASASGASAAAITVSLSGTNLVIDDPTGVNQGVFIDTAGGGFEINEILSGNTLSAGAGVTASVVFSSKHWTVVPTNPAVTITRVIFQGGPGTGSDFVNASGVTNVPVTLFGEGGADNLIGGSLGDTINGGTGNDSVYGGPGNDVLTGWLGNDSIYGENGDDTIYENDGYADTIDGDNDYDELTRDSLDTATAIEKYL